MRQILTLALVFSTIRLATPLVLAALGGLYSERSGVINIALEGLLLAGAFTAASVTYYAHSPWVGLLAAMIAGAFVAYILAVACIRFKADQVVTGTGINILFIGLPAVLSGALFLSSGSTPQIPKENLLPTLSGLLPGFMPHWRILSEVSVMSLLALVLVLFTRYVLYRTPFGLRLRAVGENPEAADAAGVRVNRIRYVGVILSGALAGIGGAYLSIGQSSLFTRNMAAGRGFIALAALIFGKWRPVQTMLACLLFGLADALTIQLQGVPVSILSFRIALIVLIFLIFWFIAHQLSFLNRSRIIELASAAVVCVVVSRVIYATTRGIQNLEIPVQFIQMIPYVVTIVVLAGFIGHSRAPRALGTPYQKER
ncbi:MAG: ral nucleoside transport system permease protein [Blastocatellia bacterium]|jgi:simple sugar transport system permease protein|nr:ral nucleoside transport system permease protein [Blastocatellia bacterium]